MDVENQAEIQAPGWMLWAARIMGIIAAGLWIFAGFWNLLKIVVLQWNCIVASVMAFLFSIVILCIEATPLVVWGPCAPYTEKMAEKTALFKYWQRALFYGISAFLTYFFCTAAWVANLAVFLLSLLVAFTYGFMVFKHKRMTGDLA